MQHNNGNLSHVKISDFCVKAHLVFHQCKLVFIFFQERPLKLCFTTSNSSAKLIELSYEEGDKVWVISSNVTR